MPGKNIVGYALYYEHRRDGVTLQNLWTPPILDVDDNVIPGLNWGRRVSEDKPKSRWLSRTTAVPALAPADFTAVNKRPVQETFAALESIYASIERVLSNAEDGKWQVAGPPILLEVTTADSEKLKIRSAPEALIRRLIPARVDLNYPAEIFGPDLPPASPGF